MIKRFCDQCGVEVNKDRFSLHHASIQTPCESEDDAFIVALSSEGDFCSAQCMGTWLLEKAAPLLREEETP